MRLRRARTRDPISAFRYPRGRSGIAVGVHAAGDDEVAGAFGRRVDQIGGFDLEEAFRVEEAADFLRHLVPQDHVALQRRAAQVEVAVFHAQVVAAVRNLFRMVKL